jgi:hypothetical protein
LSYFGGIGGIASQSSLFRVNPDYPLLFSLFPTLKKGG